MADMAKRSVQLNHLEQRFIVIHKNIKEIADVLPKESFDYIVTNPPYKKLDSGLINEDENKFISRHEVKCNIEDIANISFQMLKDKGEIYMIHRPERLTDILYELRKHQLEPKIIRFVHPKKDEAPKMFLVKAVKNAKPFLKIEKPLYIYDENGDYTEEILRIYHKSGEKEEEK